MAQDAAGAAHRYTRSGAIQAPHYNSDSSRKRRKYGLEESDGETWLDGELKENKSPVTSPRRSERTQAMSPLPSQHPRREPPLADIQNYTSAADRARAVVESDGWKPREERTWDFFHPDLDLDMKLTTFKAQEVDGVSTDEKTRAQDYIGWPMQPSLTTEAIGGQVNGVSPGSTGHFDVVVTPPKRGPGRPPRRPESMLHGLGSPPAQRPVPIPAHNPRERLTLPKPSFRKFNPFQSYEDDKLRKQKDFVTRPMIHAGYQVGDETVIPKQMIRLGRNLLHEDPEADAAAGKPEIEPDEESSSIDGQVEYDMDEQDEEWLESYNSHRKQIESKRDVLPPFFEITMTQIEKQWHKLERRIPKPNPKPPQTQRARSSSSAAVNGEVPAPGEEQDSKCAICDDGDCENTNAIVFCDGCDLAVHQECYGVPFIPEGQWLCRKCQQIGRAIPTCIFCPNTEGAFKQTTESRWAHLLCSIWIPEVSLGNSTFMEPVMEVSKVPKSRWKLTCYICNQKMGACIQCGNKNCYLAFHVTCARRAKLYLKMKSSHLGPATLDASVLKALCDKHVPPEWQREHDVDRATAEAKAYYRREMKGTRWADSQASALAMVPLQQFQIEEPMEDTVQDDGSTNALSNKQKRKRLELAQKNVWRFPSGAPIVPHAVYEEVLKAIARYDIPGSKDFVAEVCKYWTLKREARRGAALLKRLQQQMETFSSTDVSRRDFAGMGAAGGPRLQRRIEFADILLQDMAAVRELCKEVRRREAAKLSDAQLLRSVVDTIYFPIPALLRPIINKAYEADRDTEMFKDGLDRIAREIELRTYSSVDAFSVDAVKVFHCTPGLESANDLFEAHERLSSAIPRDSSLLPEQREFTKLAKRVLKSMQQPLHDAKLKEAELGARSFGTGIQNFDSSLKLPGANVTPGVVGKSDADRLEGVVAGHSPVNGRLEENGHPTPDPMAVDDLSPSTKNESADGDVPTTNGYASESQTDERDDVTHRPSTSPSASGANQAKSHRQGDSSNHIVNGEKKADDEGGLPPEPLTPPRSENELLAPLAQGGVPWYLETFDPIGTTVHEERWTGREVLRGMSEELSELDEDELKDLGGDMDVVDIGNAAVLASDAKVSGKKAAKKRKRRKGFPK